VIEFLKCFKLRNFHRYSIGYCIGGTFMYSEIEGYSFWIVFTIVVLVVISLMDAISIFLSELDIDDEQQQQIRKEKIEQYRRENEN
jgi:hypothetical protein